MPRAEQINIIIADTYREASLSLVNMRQAVEALEAIRFAALKEPSPYVTWHILDAQIGQAASASALSSLLIRLRDQWEKITLDAEGERLKNLFDQDLKKGWIGWLHSFAEALTDFRLDFCLKFCDLPFPYPAWADPTIEEIRKFTLRAAHSRWAEAYDLFVRLSEQQDLLNPLRAKLLSIAADIITYHLYQPDLAESLLDRADLLSPEMWRVAFARGNHLIEKGGDENRQKAKECYQRTIELAPEVAVGYTGLGECFEKEDNLEEAEAHYLRGTKCPESLVDSYICLLKFHGHKAIFEQREAEIPDLVKQISNTALSDKDRYEALIHAGYNYEQNGRCEEAHSWYQRSIDFDPLRLNGYLTDGYLYLSQGDRDMARAVHCFQKVIEVADEALDGYWAMSWVAENQEDWSATFDWCRESYKRRPQWERLILQRLEQIALNRYQKEKDSDGALQFYNRIRELAGDTYEAGYRNLVGNLHYYFGRYQEAADEYKKAIAENPEGSRYHANLALALENTVTASANGTALSDAVQHAKRAHELAPDFSEYAELEARLGAKLNFVSRYGQRALQYFPVGHPIRVYVGAGVTKAILNSEMTDISQQLKELIEQMRKRIVGRYGLPLPGINFSDAWLSKLNFGEYKIELRGDLVETGGVIDGIQFAVCPEDRLARLEIEGTSTVWDGFLEGRWIGAETDLKKAASDNLELLSPAEYMLRHIEAVMIRHLDRFCGVQVVASLINVGGDNLCAGIADDPDRLNQLTKKLKERLRAGEPIADLDPLCEEVSRLPEAKPAGAERIQVMDPPISRVASFSARLGHSSPLDRKMLAEGFLILQEALFNELGVLIPQMVIEESDLLSALDFQLRINGRDLEAVRGLAPDEVWAFVPYEDLRSQYPDCRYSPDPISGSSAVILKALPPVMAEFEIAGTITFDPIGYVVLCARAALWKDPAEVLTRETVSHYLAVLENSFPSLIKTVRHYFNVDRLTSMLREKLRSREGASVKDLPTILDEFLENVR